MDPFTTNQALTTSELNAWSHCKMLHYWSFRAGPRGYGIVPLVKPTYWIEGGYMHEFVAEFLRHFGQTLPVDAAVWLKKEGIPKYSPDLYRLILKAQGVAGAYMGWYPDDPKLQQIGVEKEFFFRHQQIPMAGKIDFFYKSEEGHIGLRELKYISPRSLNSFVLIPTLQHVIYAHAILYETQQYPDFVEPDYVMKSKINQKKGETDEAYVKRVRETYLKDKKLFERLRIWVSPTQWQEAWKHMVMPKASSIPATVPYIEDGSCFRYNHPCAYKSFCEALLEGDDDPTANTELMIGFREKDKRHEELE